MARDAKTQALRPDQFDRYRRHLSLPELGLEGQQRLLDSSVLLIGIGGLGCPTALYLAAAGVGRLGLVDDDVVDASNLQRQILFRTDDVGRAKVEVADERIRALNPDVQVDRHACQFRATNALELIADYDLVIDGTDNFPTRYLSNDACVLAGKPNVYGSIFRFEGQASFFDASVGPCYRCLFPEPPPPGTVPSCAEGGVLGVLPGIISMVQATEAVKFLTGLGELLVGRLLLYDALAMEFNEFRLKKDRSCPICGDDPTIRELIDYEGFCGLPAPEDQEKSVMSISAGAVMASRDRGDALLLLDVRGEDEYQQARIEDSTLIPLHELEGRISEIESWKARKVVVLCHHGARSQRAARILVDRGFEDVENLDGGIEAWSVTVDSKVPRYTE